MNISGKDLQEKLDAVHITVNKNAIPNDPQKPTLTSGIRIGTPAVTTRGMNEDDMRLIGKLIYRAATDFENAADEIRQQVIALTEKYPLYE
jgi:glycine hydroxymethyltransferase